MNPRMGVGLDSCSKRVRQFIIKAPPIPQMNLPTPHNSGDSRNIDDTIKAVPKQLNAEPSIIDAGNHTVPPSFI